MKLIKRIGDALRTPSRGVGDTIAKLTKVMGIEPCGGCEWRREKLNQWLPYRRVETSVVPAQAGPILAVSGGGDLQLPSYSANQWGGATFPSWQSSPAPVSSSSAGKFSCGVDVTDRVKQAISETRTAFHGWTDDKRHKACMALSSLRTGDYAWDILQLRDQAVDDVLNKRHRPPCATSGATPACGSSVTVDGSCHFAGSANYVIFGVMCMLCFNHYDAVLKRMPWYADKTVWRHCKGQFSASGMLHLINLYKKWGPRLKGNPPAKNLEAAKQWALAGRGGWPSGATTPTPDRANCATDCPFSASDDFAKFDVSWYPHLNPYVGADRSGKLPG